MSVVAAISAASWVAIGFGIAPTYREWKFQSELWLFLIGRDRTIAKRFEGLIVATTIRSALEPLLA